MMMLRRVAVLAAASSSSAVRVAPTCSSLRSSSVLAFCPSNHPKNQQQKRSQVNRFAPPTFFWHKNNNERFSITTTTRQMSLFGGSEEGVINKEAMTKIIEDVSSTSREESGYVIIDVRGHDEIAFTGKLNDCVETLPLPNIQGGLAMEEEDFKAEFGFDKPGLDETIVFSCKAGVRAKQACKLAKNAGYSKIMYYAGGSNEWFC
jgi:rhodanese-related sulfurtransferase